MSSGAQVYTFSNLSDGQTITVELTSPGGGATSSFTGATWAGGAAPVQTSPSGTDVYTFVKVKTNVRGSVVQALQ